MSATEVEKALTNLEGLVRKRAVPSHFVARHVLLALGAELRAEAAASSAALIERARVAGRAAGPAWAQAVQTELTLAIGEFAQSVDPRYLSLPDYDVDYTRSARERLADRLRAASALGFALTPREAGMLELADRVLATHEAQRGSERSDPETSTAQSHRGPRPGSENSHNAARN